MRRSGWGRKGGRRCVHGESQGTPIGKWEPPRAPGDPRSRLAPGRPRAPLLPCGPRPDTPERLQPPGFPRDPKPQGPRYRPSRPLKPPLQGVEILLGVFTPKGFCWDISLIFNYFLKASPLLRGVRGRSALPPLLPPPLCLALPSHPPTEAPGPRGPPQAIFPIVGNDRGGSGGPDEPKK